LYPSLLDSETQDTKTGSIVQIPRPMIVEFVGIPGSGKTTLAAMAGHVLCDLGLKAMLVPEAGRYCLKRTLVGQVICRITPSKWQDRMLWAVFRRLAILYRLKFAIKHGTLSWRAVNVWVHHQLPLRVLGWFWRDASYYEFFRDHLRPGEALVLDEGLLHRATSLYTSVTEEPDFCAVADYVGLLSRSDLVIGVRASLDSCVARLHQRGENRRYFGKNLALFLTRATEIVEQVLQCVKDGRWDVIEVNNEVLGSCAADLTDLLGRKIADGCG